MIAPNSARAPSVPGVWPAMATIGPTAAKVTPIITGRRMPKYCVAPRLWMIDTIPQTKRSAEIRNATSRGSSASARPTISGTAIAPAYITSTCWNPSVSSRGSGSISSTGWTRCGPGLRNGSVASVITFSFPRRRRVAGHRCGPRRAPVGRASRD